MNIKGNSVGGLLPTPSQIGAAPASVALNNNEQVSTNYITDVMNVDLYNPASDANRSGYFDSSSVNIPASNVAFGVRQVHYVASGFVIVEARCFMTDSSITAFRNTYNQNVSSGWIGWDKIYDSRNKPTPADIGAVSKTGDSVSGDFWFGDSNKGLSWSTADGTIFHFRPWSPNNVLQLTIRNPDKGITEYGVVNIGADGNWSFSNPEGIRNAIWAAPADIYKYFPLSAASPYYGRKITDALHVNLGDTLGDENRPGWVYLTETTQLPDGFNHGIREVYYYGSEWITVKLTGWGGSHLNPCTVYNTYRGGSIGWTGWEWENPPVEVGVEYCTTERWSGKPVYTKRIDFLELPSNSEKRVAHNTSGKVFLGVRMVMSNYTPLTVGDGASVIGVSATEVYVRTTTTFNQTATAQIWYTKA